MFSFHKPKIYRSNLGCCICKAKSSSSRFTDSKKYENEFERCFRIQEKRSGEICNACVLLVKRWKKLSPENRQIKHWHHVVDARAGPGTKLTGNRRQQASYNSAATSSSTNDVEQVSVSGKQRSSAVLPLSSSQTNNQSTCGSSAGSSSTATSTRRSNSFSNKARAIDTNVSTFTFGEPYRRHYGPEPNYSVFSGGHFAKPQSALSSSAFESVIKRFRQRQQQEQLEAERRQQNRLQRSKQQRQSSSVSRDSYNPSAPSQEEESTSSTSSGGQDSLEAGDQIDLVKTFTPATNQPPSKRIKRHSDSIGSLTIEGCRVSSLLDGSLWRKERICCGIIFRGLNNEVAVFPQLLKPCPCRLQKLRDAQAGSASKNQNELVSAGEDRRLLSGVDSPPPRVTKSGSISSCDSNTSGTGSMEQPLNRKTDDEQQEPSEKTLLQVNRRRLADELDCASRSAKQTSGGVLTQPSRSRGASKRSAMSSSRSTGSSGEPSTVLRAQSPAASLSSSSGASSSRLLMMADIEDDDVDDGLILADDDESTTDDAASSVDSINELTGKKPGANVVDAAMG